MGCKQARLILLRRTLTELQFTLHRLPKLSKDQAIALFVSNSGNLLNTSDIYFSTFFIVSSIKNFLDFFQSPSPYENLIVAKILDTCLCKYLRSGRRKSLAVAKIVGPQNNALSPLLEISYALQQGWSVFIFFF